MARLDFRLPDIGEGIAEAEIVEWHAEIGDEVKEGQVIASVMTDKATVEMEAPADGTLTEKGAAVGDMLPVGTTLFVLKTAEQVPAIETGTKSAGKPDFPPAAAAEQTISMRESAPPDRGPSRSSVLASPAVRQRAKSLGIDLARVKASGDHVTHEDLDRYLLENRSGRERAATIHRNAGVVPDNAKEIRVVGLRRQIARHMEEAKRHIPHFTYVEEVDVTELERLRQSLNSERPERPALQLLSFLCVAACRALREFPQFNAHYDDEREVMTLFRDVHIGIATHTDGGLIVPVLRHADGMQVWELADAIKELANDGRSGQLQRNELRGSTITISSLGKLGGIFATPIINRPEVAILAPGRVVERIAMTAIGSAPRLIMNLSISCDHRVIDGYVAASFIQKVKRLLEFPDQF